MEIQATVDVGNNITGMLERLAAQLGTTADKVFPWYVQQAHLEGMTTLIALAVALFVFGMTFAISLPKACENDDGPAFPVSLISGFLLFFSVLGTFFEGIEAVRKINNPNYYAMKMLTQDIGRMVGK